MIIGIDEAGRRPVIGPLVVGCVGVEDQAWMGKVGIRDSKDLTPARRGSLYEIIGEKCSFSILEIPARAIDKARARMTLNRLEVLAFASSLASLLKGEEVLDREMPGGCTVSVKGQAGLPAEICLDAADVNEERFGSDVGGSEMLALVRDRMVIVSRHRADRDIPVVGAASILAKVTRDRRVREIEASVGIPIGSGYPSDPVTRAFLAEWVKGKGSLPDFARKSWDTSRRILTETLQTRLF